MQYSPSISSCGQPPLSLLYMAESDQGSLDDEIPSSPALCLFMVIHHHCTRCEMNICAYISFILQFSFEQWLYVRFPGRSQKKIWVVSFVVSTALVLTPAPVIELRYYTTPFFLLFLHSHTNSNTKLQFIGVFYVLQISSQCSCFCFDRSIGIMSLGFRGLYGSLVTFENILGCYHAWHSLCQ